MRDPLTMQALATAKRLRDENISLSDDVRDLRRKLAECRSRHHRSERENRDLRRDLRQMKRQLAELDTSSPWIALPYYGTVDDLTARIREYGWS